MMRALIIDTETTGLDPCVHRAIEVGVILYDLRMACPIVSYSSLIGGAPVNEAASVNGIPPDVLPESPDAKMVWSRVDGLLRAADVVLAHRAEFDSQFVPPDILSRRRWVCTKFHVSWPRGRYGESLVQLALEHGLGVSSAHRAMTDCDLISRLLTRVHEVASLVEMVRRAMRPRVKVVALTRYEEIELTKSAGFAWNPSDKEWWRDCFEDEAVGFPFSVRISGVVPPIGAVGT